MHNVVDGVSKLICGTLFYTPYYYDFVLFKKPKNYKLQAATAKIIPPGKVYGLTGKHHIVYVCNTFIPLENWRGSFVVKLCKYIKFHSEYNQVVDIKIFPEI